MQRFAWVDGPRQRAGGKLVSVPFRRRGEKTSHPRLRYPVKSNPLPRLLPPLLLLLLRFDGAQAGTYADCPDGSAGLTVALYAAGDPTAYADVTCIPQNEFQGYDSYVVLTGLAFLSSIEENAFNWFSTNNLISITGAYPALKTIGMFAFNNCGTVDSKVDLSGVNHAELQSLHYLSFFNFRGTITWPTGPLPNYIGCTRLMLGHSPNNRVVLHAPDEVPLTKALYEAAAAADLVGKGGGRGGVALLSNVTCIPDAGQYQLPRPLRFWLMRGH